MSSLHVLRKKIDRVDREIVALMGQRIGMGEEIAIYKNNLFPSPPYTDRMREKEQWRRLMRRVHNPLLKRVMPQLFELFLSMNKQTRMSLSQFSSSPQTIGIIGKGRFGKLLRRVFQKHWKQATVIMFSRSHQHPDIIPGLSQLARCDIVLPCVPISKMSVLLQQIQPHLQGNTIVIDVCSVKEKPVQWMKHILPPGQPIIATHPMFGPDSTKNGEELYGTKMMVHNVSAPTELFQMYIRFWEGLGVTIIPMTPKIHDQYAAYSICYNHYIGRIAEMVGIHKTPIDTKGFEVILDALQYVTRDSWQLFIDMQRFNPYAHQMRKKVLQVIKRIEKMLLYS